MKERCQNLFKMDMVVSSVVSAGPQVLEDLDTPYVGLQDEPTNAKRRRRSKSKSRRPNNKSQLGNRKMDMWVNWVKMRH